MTVKKYSYSKSKLSRKTSRKTSKNLSKKMFKKQLNKNKTKKYKKQHKVCYSKRKSKRNYKMNNHKGGFAASCNMATVKEPGFNLSSLGAITGLSIPESSAVIYRPNCKKDSNQAMVF